MDIKNINFVNLHAHSGVGSPFDGFGYPQDHMEYAYSNGCKALALTDHGNMNGFAYQVLHAKKMKEEGKDFKPIFGVEAYFIEDVVDWKEKYEQAKLDKKKARQLDNSKSGINIEAAGESKSQGRSELNRSRHIVLVAMNQTGLNNIFKMVTESHKGDYFYRKPRIDFALLEKYGEGVIAASACLGGIYAGAYWSKQEEGEEAVLAEMRRLTKRFQSILGDRWYGELQWNRVPQQHALNNYVIKMHKEFGIKLISTADSHYPTPDAWKDRELYKRLGWLGRSKPEWLDMELPTEIQELECELYPKNAEQMWESYQRFSEECGVEYDDDIVLQSIKETETIGFERIEDFLPDNTVRLPDFVVPAGYTADEYLEHLTHKKMAHAGDNIFKNQEYRDRLDQELKVISDRGFSKYFLTMAAISGKANEMMLSGPGRGSAAGSLVAYLLGITQVDPIKYGLLFSRFLRADAKDYPDIDYDVASPMELKDLLINEWGENSVAPISNWNTLQLKSLIKDVSKFYKVEFKEVNAVTSRMISEATAPAKKKHGIKAGMYIPTWEEVLEFSDTLKAFLKKYPDIENHVKAMVGQYRSCSRHAGGVVIAEDLDKHMPLINSGGVIQTPWSEGQNVRQLEPMGFIKFDILGLTTLRMIEGCIERILCKGGNCSPTYKDIQDFYNEHLHPDVMDFDDQTVYENVFHQGKWAGIFQFTESGAQNFCKRAQPTSIVDISAITSIFRPGPLSAGVDKDYVKAKEYPEDVWYENEIVREVTQETYGFLIFQEQIAMLAHKLGKDISLDEGNLLRKLLTKKGTGKGAKQKNSIRDRFVQGCIEKGMKRNDALHMWQNFEYFSGYGFNKSHAVCYSMISYQCAWLMTYHEGEWMASYLDKVSDKKKESAIATAKTLGYNISQLDINKSGREWEYEEATNSLLQPLTTIKGLGASAMDQVVEHRPFNTVEDFLFHPDVKYSKLNKKALDVLVRAGACNDLIDDRFNGAKHFWSAAVVDRPKNKKKFGENIELYKNEGDFDKNELISFKSELTGIFPFDLVMSDTIRVKLEKLPVVPISEYEMAMSVDAGREDDQLLVWFVPRKLTRKKTARGSEYWILDVVDSNNAMVSIKCWNPRSSDTIFVNQPYMARLDHSDQWGFSTRSIKHNFRLLG
ncbi:MAG: putative DNA polymerase III subunit alpha [Prokaryotic dsDNA virus sp.]|nr:MAG: putative DNA polymerase III subunit alpha [Prokaryotic dsDNA virus sp.]